MYPQTDVETFVRECYQGFYREDRIPTDLEFGRWFNHSLYGPKWDPAQAFADLLGDEIAPRAERMWDRVARAVRLANAE